MTRKQLAQESGQSMIEYALLVGLLVFAVLSGISMLGSAVDGLFSQLQTSIDAALVSTASFADNVSQSDEAATPGEQVKDHGNPNAPGLAIAPGQNDTAGKPEDPGKSSAPGQSIVTPGKGAGDNPGKPGKSNK